MEQTAAWMQKYGYAFKGAEGTDLWHEKFQTPEFSASEIPLMYVVSGTTTFCVEDAANTAMLLCPHATPPSQLSVAIGLMRVL